MRLLLVMVLSTWACASAPARPEMPEPAHLPQAARQVLTENMLNHGNNMSDLLWATLFLDDQSVYQISEQIRTAPRLAQPISKDATELNASLPAEFFALQQKLTDQAAELSRFAKQKDPEGMAAAYGALAQTCVQCHSIYLMEPPSR